MLLKQFVIKENGIMFLKDFTQCTCRNILKVY